MVKYTNEFLSGLRKSTDPLADEVVTALLGSGYKLLNDKSYSDYITNWQKMPVDFPDVLKNYFEHIFKVHHEVQGDNYLQGLKVFRYHAPLLLASLGYLSLPYCYAAADGAQVLYMSERISSSPGKRLLETAQFVFDVCSPNAFEKEGKAIISIAKVRLMHATIRHHIYQSGRWDMKYGAPINQEDMAGTNLAFSFIAIRGLRKLGVVLSGEESLAYLKLWNHIGKLGGVQSPLLPDTLKQAFQLDQLIAKRNFRPSHEGQALAHSLSKYLDESNPRKLKQLPASEIIAYMVGDEVGECLGLKASTVTSRFIRIGQVANALLASFPFSNVNGFSAAEAMYKKQVGRVALNPFTLPSSLKD